MQRSSTKVEVETSLYWAKGQRLVKGIRLPGRSYKSDPRPRADVASFDSAAGLRWISFFAYGVPRRTWGGMEKLAGCPPILWAVPVGYGTADLPGLWVRGMVTAITA